MAKVTNVEIMNKLDKLMEYCESIDSRVKTLEGSKSKQVSTKKGQKKTYATKSEAIDAWCKAKGYSEADRKAYGEMKKGQRQLQKQAYEMTNAQFTEKVPYKTWKEAYNKNLAKLSK